MASAKKDKSVVDRLYDFFCSIKLSIFVLIGLAVTSIIGTVVQQGRDPQFYIQQYGESTARLFELLNFTDMYHAWWFTMLLALLLVNITFCSIRRYPGAHRQMTDKDPVYDGRSVAAHQRWTTTSKSMSVEQAAEAAEGLLSGKMGTVRRQEKDGKIYLMASKGSWSRLGVYVTHLSLFLFAIGAIIGLQWGFKGNVNIIEGQAVQEVRLRPSGEMMDLGFAVRCDKFDISYYESGGVSDYMSWLAVLENGKMVDHKRIEVNHPLIYKGIYFYQSSYGHLATVSVQDGSSNALVTNRGFNSSRPLYIGSGSDGRGGQADYFLSINRVVKEPVKGLVMRVEVDTPEGLRPMYEGVVYPPTTARTWWQVGPYRVRLDGPVGSYTGLQVAYDPGVPTVWAGCILITLGLIVSFFFSHRRVWARVTPQDKGVEVQFVGNASRNRISFENWFEELAEAAEETF